MNVEKPSGKTSSVFKLIEILVGLLALATSILNLFAFKLFVAIAGPTLLLFGIVLLVIGIFSAASVSSYRLSGLTKRINLVTSVLIIFTGIMILFVQILIVGERWLNLFFGLGLLGYGVARISVGALTHQFNFSLRTFITAIGTIIAVISAIMIAFPLVPIQPNFYLTYVYFVNITFILIGVDCLASAIMSYQ